MSERIADRRKLMDEAEGTMSVLQFEHPLPESDEDEESTDCEDGDSDTDWKM